MRALRVSNLFWALALGVAATVIAMLAWSGVEIWKQDRSVLRDFLFWSGTVAGVVGLIGIAFGSGTTKKFSERERSTASLEEEVTLLKQRISQNEAAVNRAMVEAIAPISSEPVDIETLVARLRASVSGDLSAELEKRVEERIAASATRSYVREKFEFAIERLDVAIKELTDRGKMNLGFGILITVVAVSLLFHMSFGSGEHKITTVPEFLASYAPRLTTVAFVEVFAFFFLRLYKSSLNEIKHYQGEITLLNSQRIALETAGLMEDPRAAAVILTALTQRGQAVGSSANSVEQANMAIAAWDRVAQLLGKKDKEGG